MATSQTASINIDAYVNATKNGRSTTGYIRTTRNLNNGTLVNLADKAYYELRTIASAGAPDNLDFAGGGLIDVNGDAITWVEFTTLIISAPSTNLVDITVGNGTNPANFGSGAGTILVKPGETKILINTAADGAYPIAAGSTDNLKLAIGSGTADYEILAVGRSA